MKNRRTLKRGGRFYGRGTFGSVMGEPRLPCADETFDEVKDNQEVSKITHKITGANEEYAVIDRLHEVLTDAQITHLRNYLVLPIKKCEVNLTAVKAYPIYKSPEWYKNKQGAFENGLSYDDYDDEMLYDGRRIPSNKLNQVVYPMAQSSIDDLIGQYTTSRREEDIYSILNHICQLYDGLRELQKLDLVHCDIKGMNTMVIDGRAKFIDNADLTQVNITNPLNKEGFMKVVEWTAYASHYFPWSELVIVGLTEQYKSNNLNINEVFRFTFGSERFERGIPYVIEQLKLMFRIFNDNRLKLDPDDKDQMMRQFIHICIARLYGLTGMSRMTEPLNENHYDLRLVENIIQEITPRATYGYDISSFEHSYYPEHIRRAIKDFKMFINKLNTDLESDTDVASDEFRMKRMDYVLKMNDIHSMGMLLMGFLLFIRPADVSDAIRPVLKKALELGLMSLKQLTPMDIDSYYEHRDIHFNGVYSLCDDLKAQINAVLNPAPFVASVSSVSRRSSARRTVSRSSKPRRTPRRSAKRRTVKRTQRRKIKSV